MKKIFKYLNKKFFIKADGYSTNAVKMICMTGGETLINRRSTY